MSIRAGILALCLCASGFAQSAAPRIGSDEALKDWAVPVAARGVRPGHFSEREDYAVPADNYQTYPVYHPDSEPKGDWDWLQRQKPKPLVDSSAIRAKQDWVRAGPLAFRDLNDASCRTMDPTIIPATRDRANFKGVHLTRSGGFVLDQKWVVPPMGVELSSTACLTCHVKVETHGGFQQAGPGNPFPPSIEGIGSKNTSVLVKAFELFSQATLFRLPTGAPSPRPGPRIRASRLRAANSRTAVTCSRDTSNNSMISSTVAPDSRFQRPWQPTYECP